MRIGLSSYSLQADISSGKKTILDAMTYASEIGAACFEVVPIDFSLYEEQTGRMDERMIAAVRERAAALHLPISNYAVGSNLAQKDPPPGARRLSGFAAMWMLPQASVLRICGTMCARGAGI